MKTVFVRPERCVGCLQCRLGCAVAHSRSGSLYAALDEEIPSLPRIHVAAGMQGEAFPNRCRHCDPAPCQRACLPGAIERDPGTGTILIEARRCIRCASCAMACPFGVIRFGVEPRREDSAKSIAVKCDNCIDRQRQGLIPACVESCKTGALVFREFNEVMEDKSKEASLKGIISLKETRDEGATPMEMLRALRFQDVLPYYTRK